MRCTATGEPAIWRFERSQITAPAGAAKTIARQRTISVRSITDV